MFYRASDLGAEEGPCALSAFCALRAKQSAGSTADGGQIKNKTARPREEWKKVKKNEIVSEKITGGSWVKEEGPLVPFPG